MKIELDMYQTLALAVLVLMLGKFLRERVRMLASHCAFDLLLRELEHLPIEGE